MNQTNASLFVRILRQKWLWLPIVLILAVILYAITGAKTHNVGERYSISYQPPVVAEQKEEPAQQGVPEDKPDYEYVVADLDNPSVIFDKLWISQQTLMQVMESDLNILALDTLHAGSKLSFWLNPETRQLDKLELYLNPARQVVFRRVGPAHFEFEEINHKGQWIPKTFYGPIYNNFAISAKKQGVTSAEIVKINDLLKEKLDFARDLRAGDTFSMIRSEQFIDGKPSGNTEILAFRIKMRGAEINAFLHSDGSYYDSEGRSLTRAFSRYPYAQNRTYRISSRFNPKRKHPVTGRIAPHNGVDFAAATGTPVLSTGDGVVKMVRNHPYAGKYVVIQHGGKYMTRYLHLSRIKVVKGQRVVRGQVIGLAGATGRVTGPHIHYELHINGRPVNPLTANIPMSSAVSEKERPEFNKAVEQYIAMMDRADAKAVAAAN
ncbi:Murein DD-endopeptidase MepM [Vibrio stylophorae]|uniref:Murein DD-endopeptidase MepM n=1 Tax=Vibrio stylophorae TaxID=659351 RepID=A0ABM8ZXY2_9VIBR|nr:peptidoglycan DD-metalloendopeptidase family protein [Vibrio stylophorae]CAH0535678.1 Murein DD-endopeptidase MepM [Vibrio stylophorae]